MATRGRILSGFYRVLGGGGGVGWLFKLVKKHFFFYLLARRGSVNWRPWTDWSPRDRVTALQLVGWRETRQVNPSRSSCTGLGSVPVPIRLDLTAGLTDFFLTAALWSSSICVHSERGLNLTWTQNEREEKMRLVVWSVPPGCWGWKKKHHEKDCWSWKCFCHEIFIAIRFGFHLNFKFWLPNFDF